ncbi:MAG: protein kinase [Gemmatimonadales bacterium]|nr:protein kinase [Gemmatimonadales bacterium]
MAEPLDRLQSVLGDRYEFVRELGRGGMATVYLAKDLKHDRDVAVKVLHADLAASIGGDRFEREIRLAGRLQHPHILGMYDSGVADGLMYYVMPFVTGESLRDRLDREGQLPVDDAMQIALEVADALGYAHEQQIVHRDIKPENVLLSGGHVVVADFGIARAVEEGAQKLTQTGMAIGTPTYMAPEQGMGESVGPTADIYSLGCMLFEMLAGEPPFAGKNASAILAKHVMEQVPSVRIIRQSVPEEVELAIFAALGKSPADRPQSCAEFGAMLVAAPSGHTSTRLMTMRHTTARRTMSGMTNAFPVQGEMVTPLWRRPWAVALAAVVLLGGGFGGWRLMAGGGEPPLLTGGLSPNRIAVLYFEDASPAQELGYLTDGLTEGLIRALAEVPELNVVSRNGVAPYRGSEVSPDSIAHALDAGTLVRGAVSPAGGKLRISLSLFDGNSGVDLPDSRTAFEGSASDLVAVSDSLAQEAARLIRTRLGDEVRLRDQRSRTSSGDAWMLVQRAERLRKTGEAAAAAGDTASRTREFASADSLLALAERFDGKWAQPPILRGLVSYARSRLTRDPFQLQSRIDSGLVHVNRALAIDPGSADALELRGNLRYWAWLMKLRPDPKDAGALLDSARADLERAVEINPNQAGAHATLSHLYNQIDGKTTDIKLAAREALRADAYLENADVILGRLFLAEYDDGQFVEARRWCDETRRRFPGTYPAPRCELFMLTTQEREPDVARAWRLADSVAEMAPASRKEFYRLNSNIFVAAVLGRAGLTDSARKVAMRSLGDEVISPTRDLSLVAAFALLQAADTTAALDQLKIYFAANPAMRQAYAEQRGWWFRGISSDPRYRRLTAQ